MNRSIKKIIVASFLLACASSAFAVAEEARRPVVAGGSFRTVGFASDNYNFPLFFGRDNDFDGASQSLLRLTAAGGAPKTGIHYEIHAVQSLDYSDAARLSGGAFASLTQTGSRYRALDTACDWWEEDHVLASLWWDRFNATLTSPNFDITIGRQAITFGKAYFWNPLDVYLPFDPRQFDREYKPGVDALRMEVPLDRFSGFTFVGVAGRKFDALGRDTQRETAVATSWVGSSLLGRFYTTVNTWDVSFQGGKVYGGYQIGGGLVGEIGTWQVRGEAAFLMAEESPRLPAPLSGDLIEDHAVLVLGTGRHFENSLELDAEYLFNGAADDGDLDASWARVQTGNSLHISEHLLGFLASYEFHPLLRGQVAPIVSLRDGSCQIQPGLTYSLSDESEVLVGAIVNLGERPNGNLLTKPGIQSEFGTFANSLYAEFKVYF